MKRLTTKTSIMGRKHDLAYGCASIWKKKLKHYRYDLIEEAVDKLGQFEDLEEELGIDLITLFKALKDGIYLKIRNDIDLFKRPRLYYSDDFKCWGFELGLGAYYVHLKDYGTLWALRREDLEDEKED